MPARRGLAGNVPVRDIGERGARPNSTATDESRKPFPVGHLPVLTCYSAKWRLATKHESPQGSPLKESAE